MQNRIAHRLLLSIALAVCGAVTLVPMLAQPAARLVQRSEISAPLRFELGGLPQWVYGGLYGSEPEGSAQALLWRVDGEGTREEIRFSIPGAGSITVLGLTPGPDGALAVFGSAIIGNEMGATLITLIAPDRKSQKSIRVWPYVTQAAAVSSDGVIWAIGFLKDEDNTRTVAYDVLRRYSQSGNLLSSVTVRARSVWGNGDASHGSYLLAGRDRVVWFTNGNEYIEFSLAGTEMGRHEGPSNLWVKKVPPRGGAIRTEQRPCGAGVSRDGVLYVCRPGKPHSEILVLDRENRTWRALPLELQPGGSFVGVEDGAPVIARFGAWGTLRRYMWVTSEAGK